MSKPLISVVMTCFNQHRFVAELVESILGQTHRNLELIVIDDGSFDGTSTLVNSYDDKRLTYVWQENAGPSDATNRGIRLARGDYIAFMGGDDVSQSHRLEQQLDQIERGFDIVFSLPKLINELSREIPYYRQPIFFAENFENEASLLRRLFAGGNFLCAPSAMARRNFFERYGQFRKGLIQLQDFDLWVRACRSGARMKRFEDPVVSYRVRDEDKNLSSSKNRNRITFEWHVIYRDFLSGVAFDLLKDAFPDGVSLRSHENDISKDVDILFLYLNHDMHIVRSLGIERAIEYFEDDAYTSELAERGFRASELFRTMSETRPYEL